MGTHLYMVAGFIVDSIAPLDFLFAIKEKKVLFLALFFISFYNMISDGDKNERRIF